MSDLRTGLVEAMARAIRSVRDAPFQWTPADLVGGDEEARQRNADAFNVHNQATAALDAALGFLTDNAEAWKAAAYEHTGDTDLDVFGSAALAALSDSRDTGEKADA